MPHSLQSMKDVKSLPTAVADQLIELTRMAYNGRLDEKYVLFDLDAAHLGKLKKTTNSFRKFGNNLLDLYAVSEFIFLNPGLQEYLSALHMSFHGLSSFDNQNDHHVFIGITNFVYHSHGIAVELF